MTDLINQIKTGQLDEAALLEYVTDNDVNVAKAVAGSPYVTEPILNIAAFDLDREVRMAVVNNPVVTKKVLEKLARDSDLEIAELAQLKLNEKK